MYVSFSVRMSVQHHVLRQQAREHKTALESRHRSLVAAIEKEQENAQGRVEVSGVALGNACRV